MAKSRAEQIREIERLARQFEPDLRRDFLEGVKRLKDDVVLKQLAEQLAAGNMQAALRLVGPVQIGTIFGALLNTTLATYFASGDATAASSAVTVWFNHANPVALDTWSRYQQLKITRLTQEASDTINQVLRRELTAGTGPYDTARKIRDSLGLTANQEQAVHNYRTALENRLSNALERKLRDGRFDSTVRRAIATDKALTKEQVDKMVSRYTERQLKHRSEMIARTESTRAINAGQQAYFETAVKDGKVLASQVRRFWVVTRDERTRQSHRAIPNMNPDGVGLNEPFKSPLGPIMYPSDPSATADNTIGCRCALFTRIIPMKG